MRNPASHRLKERTRTENRGVEGTSGWGYCGRGCPSWVHGPVKGRGGTPVGGRTTLGVPKVQQEVGLHSIDAGFLYARNATNRAALECFPEFREESFF